MTDTVTVTLSRRELTLIRLAALQRMDRLKQKSIDAVKSDPRRAAELLKSYSETRALMETDGVLYVAARNADLRGVGQ